MKSVRERFSKQERLCSVKTIYSLFEEGNIFYTTLFKIVWNISTEPQPFPARVAFSVSKKGFRLAVIRNLIKRRMREAYRKNKSHLYNHLAEQNRNISLFIILRTNIIPDYLSVEKSMKDAINKLIVYTADK